MNPWVLNSDALHEPWRLWTCHLAHHDFAHALFNAFALAIPLFLLDQQERKRFMLWALLLTPLLSLSLMPFLNGGTYCGVSGVACAAWAFAGLELMVEEKSFSIGFTMLTLLVAKFGVETLTGSGLVAHSGRWQTLSESHLYGSILGLMAALMQESLRAHSRTLRHQLHSVVQRRFSALR